MDAPQKQPFDRRTFLRRAAGAAIAVPALSSILAACEKPGQLPPGVKLLPLARQESPVTLPLYRDPIPTDTPLEKGVTLQVYNWDAYMQEAVLRAFEDQFDVKIEWTTFLNMEEGISKMSTGQIQADVFFPTVDYLSRLVEAKLLLPLNHDLIPNLDAIVWPQLQNPFYDQGWRYTVPYVIWTTGVGYRRDHIDDAEVAEKGYHILWDPHVPGKTGFYDSYRDALGWGSSSPGSPTSTRATGPRSLRRRTSWSRAYATDARITVNGVYVKLAEDEIWVHQAWSGDIVGAQYYLPKGVSTDVLGYWYPPDLRGAIANDLIVIPSTSQYPRLAHEFLNFFLDNQWGYLNFALWNGYQPPFTEIKPQQLIDSKVGPGEHPRRRPHEGELRLGYFTLQLDPEADQTLA